MHVKIRDVFRTGFKKKEYRLDVMVLLVFGSQFDFDVDSGQLWDQVEKYVRDLDVCDGHVRLAYDTRWRVLSAKT